MKQLTKEQHEAICEWMETPPSFNTNGLTMRQLFTQAFPPACCDSCADGEECETESHYPKAVFTESEVSVDRIPEETTGEYMDRVATINGRK